MSAPPVQLHLLSLKDVPACVGLGEGGSAGAGMTCVCTRFLGTGDSAAGFLGRNGGDALNVSG